MPRRNALLAAFALSFAATTPVAFAPAQEATATPESAIARLAAGNSAFASGRATHPHQDPKRLLATADGQHPVATVLACSDSRVPVELLFDEGIGDLFTVRVAGNVADVGELGSIEYGVDRLGTPALVVLGHTDCGAVAHDEARDAGLADIVAAVNAVAKTVDAGAAEPAYDAVAANVLRAIADIVTHSSVVRARLGEGKLRIVGGVYHVDSGKIDWLGRHPDEADLVARGNAARFVADDAGGGSAQAVAAPSDSEPPPPGSPTGLPLAFALVALVGTLGGAVSMRMTGSK